ncbi:MAG TPA: dTDP-4-dehydrorhamnose reductase [Bacteroidota bacterium]|nr:dTDP-4-dehydrorhamnose reductase [Bacteroidota bacterium]
MKRVLLCGSNGLLGQRLSLLLSNNTAYEVLNTSRQRSFVFDDRLFDYTQLDITQKGDVKSLVSSFQPSVIINAAAAANVDWCETHREEAWNINVVGVENLVDAARKVGARLIHVSTDYVFDGKSGPYDENSQPNPVNYYGKAKLAGENAVRAGGIPYAIVRTILLYGSGISIKNNFALWVVNSLRAGKRIPCADDQISNPTHVGDLAESLVRIFENDRRGLYHVCGRESISRYEFALRTAEAFGLDGSLIERSKLADVHQVAQRPSVTVFVALKAITELGLHAMDIREGLMLLKSEMQRIGRL